MRNAIGMLRCGDDSWLPSHVDSHERRSRDAPVIEEGKEPVGHVKRRRPSRPRFAPAHARPVEGDDLESGEEWSDRAPDLEIVGIAMKENDRRTFAAAKVAHALPPHVI